MNEWDKLYGEGRFTNGTAGEFARLIGSTVKRGDVVLELGCAMGANIPLFINANADYYGVDGSAVAIKMAHDTFPCLRERLTHCDFTKSLGKFSGVNMVFDRASLSHNDYNSIKSALGMIFDALPSGGLFVSSDWFSANHSEFWRGERVEIGTRTNYTDGQFLGAGTVHFSSEHELRELFEGWRCSYLMERTYRYHHPLADSHWVADTNGNGPYTSAVWDMVWKRP